MEARRDGGTPARPRRAPVMSDVGRLAGVSHQTVSRVINGSRHVSPRTRERVLGAMRELGYRPNSIARALVTGRSRTLGVVSFDTTLYGPASTLFGIERAAHAAGYFIIIASLKALDRSSVAEAIERLRVHGVDGVLVIVSDEESAEALLRAQSPPSKPDQHRVDVRDGPEHRPPDRTQHPHLARELGEHRGRPVGRRPRRRGKSLADLALDHHHPARDGRELLDRAQDRGRGDRVWKVGDELGRGWLQRAEVELERIGDVDADVAMRPERFAQALLEATVDLDHVHVPATGREPL